MKLIEPRNGINCTIGILSVLIASTGFAGPIQNLGYATPNRVYVGAFGGGGSSTNFNVRQFGTAYYFEPLGGPLAVNATGSIHSHSLGYGGGQLGYQWMEIVAPFNPQWGIVPAVELEGYYLGKNNFKTHDKGNDTERLEEHDFVVSYPQETSAFLSNLVLNLNLPCKSIFHPFVGAGIGGAVLTIRNATATQISPPEPGVNHFNSSTTDSVGAFAAQVKLGLNVDITQNLSIFAEYRWLYISGTKFAFGSTVYPGHPETSNWNVFFDPQHYNLGDVGLRFNF